MKIKDIMMAVIVCVCLTACSTSATRTMSEENTTAEAVEKVAETTVSEAEVENATDLEILNKVNHFFLDVQ